jgi:hypothetical protein
MEEREWLIPFSVKLFLGKYIIYYPFLAGTLLILHNIDIVILKLVSNEIIKEGIL